jgi:hypothetical protein
MPQQAFFGASRRRSVSPTKLRPTSPLRPAREYAQLLRSTPFRLVKKIMFKDFLRKILSSS